MATKKQKYATILADPPWDIQQKGGNYGADRHYNLMTLDQIKSMPVAELCEENSHCWIWATGATLEHAYDVMRKWGFTPRSVFIWIKPRLGLGNYLRNCAEFMVMGNKGKNSPILFKAQMNWGFFPLQDHSHKPEEVHKIIERCSPGPFLELFARRRQPGWDVWGNQIDSDVEIPGYPVPKLSKILYQKKSEKGVENE